MSSMTRILHVAHGIPSCHNSLVELANRLRRSGIELVTASHIDLSDVLSPHGHAFVKLTADDQLESHRLVSMRQCRKRRGLLRLWCQYVQSRRYRKLSMTGDELRKLLLQWQPDLILIDMECHKAIIQTHNSNVPVVLLSRWYTVFRQGDNPAMHTLQMPAQTLLDRLNIRYSWARLSVYKQWLSVRHNLSRRRFRMIGYAGNARPELMALASVNGIRLSSISDTSHWLIPHIYRHLPVMSLTLAAMEFSPDNDARMHYVGAMVGKQNTAHPDHDGSMEKLQAFLAQRQSKNNPLVYCSLSTFWNTQQDILATIIELFVQRDDLDLVMGLGGRNPCASWPVSTDNILLLDYAPQLEVLKHASIAITHGGVSTINEALVNGVPLLVCSSGHVDQNGCAARVAYQGVGLCCDTKPLAAFELEKSIDFILQQSGENIRGRVREIQARFLQHDSDDTAVKLLQSFVLQRFRRD